MIWSLSVLWTMSDSPSIKRAHMKGERDLEVKRVSRQDEGKVIHGESSEPTESDKGTDDE